MPKIRRIEKGSETYRRAEELFHQWIYLARGLCRKMVVKYRGLDATVDPDTMNYALEGLWYAATTYDPFKGAQFNTYASNCVTWQVHHGWHLERTRLERFVIVDTFPEGLPDVDTRLSSEAIDELRAVLAFLPDEQRDILECHYLEGLTFTQLAEILERTPGAIRSRVNLALEMAGCVAKSDLVWHNGEWIRAGGKYAVCIQCHQVFEPIRPQVPTRKFCSHSCWRKGESKTQGTFNRAADTRPSIHSTPSHVPFEAQHC